MITFITCVKHYENCHSYGNTWELLKNTLVSVCNQTDTNFNVIVVSNKTLDDFSNDSKIKNVKFIEVNWAPPASTDSWQFRTQVSHDEAMDQIRLDRGTKYVLGLSQVEQADDGEDHYVMFVDADDFIHKDLAKYVNNCDKDFLKVLKGFQLFPKKTYEHMGPGCSIGNDPLGFSAICGTSNITKVELLKQEINFDGINLNSPQTEIVKSTTEYYLKIIIGSHRFSFGHFESKGHKGGDVPFPAAIYNCTHDEQHSGRHSALEEHGRLKCEDDMVKNFSIKTLE